MTRVGIFWLGALALALLALWRLADILLPFIAGMAIAYFLDPVVDLMERRLPRWLGTLVAIVGFLGLMALFVVLVVPLFQSQFLGLIQKLPQVALIVGERLDHLLIDLQQRLGVPPEEIRSARDAVAIQPSRAVAIAGDLLGRLLTGGLAVVNVLSLIFITPVVAFYLLRDWDLMVAAVDGWLPRTHAAVIRAQARAIDRTLGGFARGQALLCLSLGAFYAITLSAAGLQFGFVVGVVTGVLTFVPFVGTITGAALSLGLALVQFDGLTEVAIIAAIYVVGQAIEGNVLQPLLVGDRVGLHPVWVIFALLAGGSLFGFVGVLVAIPVAAVIGVLARFALERYLASSLFSGGRVKGGSPS
jgi:predicted PurR-regulated permease PerM